MASADPNDLPVVEPDAPPCRHLRNKGMYVYTDGSSEDAHADYDNSIYWCLKTSQGFGPDDDFVDRRDCSNPSRSCYEPF